MKCERCGSTSVAVMGDVFYCSIVTYHPDHQTREEEEVLLDTVRNALLVCRGCDLHRNVVQFDLGTGKSV